MKLIRTFSLTLLILSVLSGLGAVLLEVESYRTLDGASTQVPTVITFIGFLTVLYLGIDAFLSFTSIKLISDDRFKKATFLLKIHKLLSIITVTATSAIFFVSCLVAGQWHPGPLLLWLLLITRSSISWLKASDLLIVTSRNELQQRLHTKPKWT